MGRFIPKMYLEWREPEAYRRGANKLSGRFSRRENLLMILMLVSYILFFLLMAIIKPPKNPHPLWVYLLLLVGCVGMYVTYLRDAKKTYTVKIREDGIKIEKGGGCCLYKYKKILGYSIEPKDVDSKMFMVLSIMVRGSRRNFGIDPAVSTDELEKILSEKCGNPQRQGT